MDTALEILGAIVICAISYQGFLLRRRRLAADVFKQRLLDDIESFRSPKTTLSAVVLTCYPEHKKAFEKYLVAAPKSKNEALKGKWVKYTEIYDWFNSFGVFGVVMAEAPHPDIEASPENIEAIERKRKKEVLAILESFIHDL